MSTSSQSIREIIATHPTAAKVFLRFDIDMSTQADSTLRCACAELQLSVEQIEEKLAEAECADCGAPPADPAAMPVGRLMQHIVRVHHQAVRQDLPKLSEMAAKLAASDGDRAPKLLLVAELVERLRADLAAHIHKEEQILFPFISQMDQDSIIAYPPAHECFRSVSHPIFMMEQEHESADHIVAELSRLTNCFEAPAWASDSHIALFAGLKAFKDNLKQHVHLENDVLFPHAIQLEGDLKSRN